MKTSEMETVYDLGVKMIEALQVGGVGVVRVGCRCMVGVL